MQKLRELVQIHLQSGLRFRFGLRLVRLLAEIVRSLVNYLPSASSVSKSLKILNKLIGKESAIGGVTEGSAMERVTEESAVEQVTEWSAMEGVSH